MEFNPDRWLSPREDGALDIMAVVFGYGRRICPGEKFAMSQLWIGMATILSVLDIRKKVDPVTGNPITPKVSFAGDHGTRYAIR